MSLSLADTLERLDYAAAERLQFCTKLDGHPFAAAVLSKAPVNTPQDREVWVGVNPVRPVAEGRPAAADVTRWAALWADLDVKPRGCPDMATAAAIVDDLADMLGTRPVYVTASGHGLQPVWSLDGGQLADDAARRRARGLLRRWGRLVRGVAERRGAAVDSVYDLPRILRCPGSVNHKAEPVAVVTEPDSGSPVDLDRLAEVLDEYNVEQLPDDPTDPGVMLSAPAEWVHGNRTCAYVRKMVDGWRGDTPAARHPWAVAQATRLAAAHRLGCVTAADHGNAAATLAERLHQLVGGSRNEPPGEVGGCLAWGVEWVSSMTDDRARKELECHMHADEPITVPRQLNSPHLQIVPPVEGANALRDEPAPPPPVASRRMSDDGNAEALIQAHGEVIRYCAARGRWLTWTGARWHFQPGNGGEVRELAKGVARGMSDNPWRTKSLSAIGTTNALIQARTDRRIAVELAELDADPWALNTPEGAVDLRTGRITRAPATAMHTRVTRCAPDADADAAVWQRFLFDTFGGDVELVDYLQRLVGYSATGHIGPHVLPFAYGSGGNGKGVFLESIGKVLGDYATTAPNSFLMARQFAQHETEIARLAGARMVLCSEVNDGDRFDEAKVKQLTGGDTLTARFMRQDHFTFAPTHHLWLLGNARPAVTSGGRSFWRRCRLIPFKREVPDADIVDDLQGSLARDQGPAILAWVIAGAVSYAAGGLREPQSVTAATADYARDQDTVGRFVDECCHLATATLKSPTSDVQNAYDQWCGEVGESPVSAKRLGAELRSRFDVGDYRSSGRRFYTGISLLRTEPEGGTAARSARFEFGRSGATL